jgi:glycosyltransferase involved in cell wall biosynthesis
MTLDGQAVTVAVVSLDEEPRIGECVNAARACGFDVVVVDGGSRDRTVEVAQACGASVVHRPFDNFAAQRNFALDEMLTSHVLFVDADEIVTSELAAEIRQAIADDLDGAWVPTLDYFAGRWMLHGGWYPQPHLRLLRRSRARFTGVVHEKASLVGSRPRVRTLTHPLVHVSHQTVSDYVRKLNRYTDEEARLRRGCPGALVARGVAEAAAVLARRLVLQSGWRDGPHGIVGAVSYAFYRFTIYAKAATAQRRVEPTVTSAMAAWRRGRHRGQA